MPRPWTRRVAALTATSLPCAVAMKSHSLSGDQARHSFGADGSIVTSTEATAPDCKFTSRSESRDGFLVSSTAAVDPSGDTAPSVGQDHALFRMARPGNTRWLCVAGLMTVLLQCLRWQASTSQPVGPTAMT